MSNVRATRYGALDALRGIAALAVLYLHELGLFARGSRLPPALAVDFFFMLSGFVLAHAYGEKLDNGLTWTRYMAARVIRLYPMLFLGIVFGGLLALIKHSLGHPGAHENIWTFILSLFLAPVGLLYVEKEYPFESPTVFLFNGLFWSLFFAVIASAVYGTSVRNLSPRILIGCLILCFLTLVAAGIWAGSVADLGRHGLLGFLGGFPRIGVEFGLGAALYKFAVFKHFPPLPFAAPAFVLLVLLMVPIGDRWTSDLLYIFLAFPLLVCVGAQSPGTRRFELLGRLSYPLYAIQWPLSEGIGYVIKTRITHEPVLVIAGSMLVCVVFAWIAVVFYDEPIRRYFGRLLKAKTKGFIGLRPDQA